MKRQNLVAVAGVPPELIDPFVSGFAKTLPILSCLPLNRFECYTKSYSGKLYKSVADKLKAREPNDRDNLLANTNFFLLYLDKNDESESDIFDKFCMETLVAPMRYPEISAVPMTTRSQRQKVANDLIREAKRAVRHAQELLAIIAEEVTNRDNKTCLLLPRRNFGKEFRPVLDCVSDASKARAASEEFTHRLRHVAQSLRTERISNHEYFVGQRGLVFRSPGKARGRHALAPGWEEAPEGHNSSCVIRGRLRFGTSYDPNFHYDCNIPKDGNLNFPSCHGTKSAPRNTHVNIAPNDNIR